jgi:hypothetical protein
MSLLSSTLHFPFNVLMQHSQKGHHFRTMDEKDIDESGEDNNEDAINNCQLKKKTASDSPKKTASSSPKKTASSSPKMKAIVIESNSEEV